MPLLLQRPQLSAGPLPTSLAPSRPTSAPAPLPLAPSTTCRPALAVRAGIAPVVVSRPPPPSSSSGDLGLALLPEELLLGLAVAGDFALQHTQLQLPRDLLGTPTQPAKLSDTTHCRQNLSGVEARTASVMTVSTTLSSAPQTNGPAAARSSSHSFTRALCFRFDSRTSAITCPQPPNFQ